MSFGEVSDRPANGKSGYALAAVPIAGDAEWVDRLAAQHRRAQVAQGDRMGVTLTLAADDMSYRCL